MATAAPLTLKAGSRLHFGLWAWGPGYERQFGGAGIMVDTPSLVLRIEPAKEFDVRGGGATDRVRRTAKACSSYFGWPELPRFRIDIVSLPRQHVGLGVGTQLDLLVAKGLAMWQGRDEVSLAELALAVDRGGRSSVGSQGFAHGGLVVEAGRGPGDTLGELLYQVAIPEEWRVLLIIPQEEQGLSGAAEREAFESLPSVPEEVHRELVRLASSELVPASRENQFDRFASAVYEYGHLAGRCYASLQETPYHSPAAARLVERLRSEGVAGVSQSSWGPTLFAVLPGEREAQQLAPKVESWLPARAQDVIVARPLNHGAEVVESD
jgi:beta-ribofuranosylaminobenzene 5'-phosphate synthase